MTPPHLTTDTTAYCVRPISLSCNIILRIYCRPHTVLCASHLMVHTALAETAGASINVVYTCCWWIVFLQKLFYIYKDINLQIDRIDEFSTLIINLVLWLMKIVAIRNCEISPSKFTLVSSSPPASLRNILL